MKKKWHNEFIFFLTFYFIYFIIIFFLKKCKILEDKHLLSFK